MRKIKCTLGTLHKAIAEIESYQKELDEKVHILMERLAEIGIEEATVRFANAIYDGTNDVRVNNTPVWIDKTSWLSPQRVNPSPSLSLAQVCITQPRVTRKRETLALLVAGTGIT